MRQEQQRRRRVPRPRPYAASARIPDYGRFCEVAELHAPLWEITYDYDAVAPYRARHSLNGYVMASNNLDLFAHLLRVAEPPSYVRPYLGSPRPPGDDHTEVSHA